MITLMVNGKTVSVPEGTYLLKAVRAAGADLPTLCQFDGLPPYGACRLCLVSITAPRPAVVAACALPVQNGLEVDTRTAEAVAARRLALELLLSRCPTSDIIRGLAAREGVTQSRFGGPTPDQRDELCMLCGLCVRVCRDLVGAAAINFIWRGTQRQVGAPFELQSEACIGCGACAAVCPTGAVKIEDRDGRRYLRTWNTEVALRRCPVCGQPFAPEPMAFLRRLVDAGEQLWDTCPACRRKRAAAQYDVVRQANLHAGYAGKA
jgi:bidirectional [NiFe] hydrogenase diaphorase subunit